MQTGPPPNTGNFFLLLLAVIGAIGDWRYLSKGGKPASQTSKRALGWTTLAVILFLIVLGLRGVGAEALGSLAGTFFLLIFFAWEVGRFFARRSNPIRKMIR